VIGEVEDVVEVFELKKGLWWRTKRSEEENGGRVMRMFGMGCSEWDIWCGMFGVGCRCVMFGIE